MDGDDSETFHAVCFGGWAPRSLDEPASDDDDGDGWILASASKNESVRLWNVMAGTCVAILAGHRGHRQTCLSLDFHPGGSLLAVVGYKK